VYAKWLRFYWDFCHKYHHDSFHSDSLPLFLRNLQDKHQSEPQQKQAQQAVSLFYEMQTAPLRSPVTTEPPSRVSDAFHHFASFPATQHLGEPCPKPNSSEGLQLFALSESADSKV
jgi:hypothetical protein